VTAFTAWLQRKRDDVDAEQPAPLSLQVTIGSLATRLHDAEQRLTGVGRLHRPDETGSRCVHDGHPWPCDTHRLLTDVGCTAVDPGSGAACQKIRGHVGDHGGTDATGAWRAWA